MDFIVEFTYKEEQVPDPPQLLPPPDPNSSSSSDLPNLIPKVFIWVLYIDGGSNLQGSRAGLALITPKANILEIVLEFIFKASNNEFEYEAILIGLRIAKDLGAKQMVVYNDSSIVVDQILGQNAAKEDHMAAYLVKPK